MDGPHGGLQELERPAEAGEAAGPQDWLAAADLPAAASATDGADPPAAASATDAGEGLLPLGRWLAQEGALAERTKLLIMHGRTRIRWDRVGRWALIAVFALVLYLYVGPAISWIKTYREAGRQRADVAQLRAENLRLRERRRALLGAAALEREARELGMVKAGERAYVIQGLPKNAR